MLAEVMHITNGKGARVAFDPVGGPDFQKLIAALTNQGIAYIYGALSEGDTPIPVLEMIPKMPVVKGYSLRLVMGDAVRRKAAIEYVAKGLASGASIARSSSTIWWKYTAIWRAAANSARSSLLFELMLHLGASIDRTPCERPLCANSGRSISALVRRNSK